MLKRSFARPVMLISAFLAAGLVLGSFAAQAQTPAEDAHFLLESLTLFRSSDRDIPAATLWDQATQHLDSARLRRISSWDRSYLLNLLKVLQNRAGTDAGAIAIDRGVVENILKTHTLAKRFCSDPLCRPWDVAGDRVVDLNREQLDPLVAPFQEPEPGWLRRSANGDFNYSLHEYAHLVRHDILNNDFYNFRVAALYFANNFADQTVTFSLFSRGKAQRPYLVTAGQDLVLLLLQNLRFSERDIQHLKRKPELSHMPDDFWNRLRKWKFRGTVRSMPVGTVAFADEPVLQITSTEDAIGGQILETIIIPIINKMSTLVTEGVRVVQAANGRPVIEGGTRRGFDGILSAMAARLAGAAVTSNSAAGRIAGIPDGGTWNHASVTMFPDEISAMIAQDNLSPGAPKLVDTYDILDGMRAAIRASGSRLGGIRLDSTLPRMNKSQTLDVVRKLATDIGYPHLKITYSDGLTVRELESMRDAPFQFALVGTEMAAPSEINGLGFVYKLVQIGDGFSTETRYPVKASEGKPSWPGALQVYRFYNDQGIMLRDVRMLESEPAPEGGVPLLQVSMVDGVLQKGFVVGVEASRPYVAKELASLPSELKNLQATRASAPYSVESSSTLTELMVRRQSEVKPDSRRRIGIVIGSFDPAHQDHVDLVKRSQALYRLDHVLVLPAGDDSRRFDKGDTWRLDAESRFKVLTDRFLGDPSVTISRLGLDGKARFTVDAVETLRPSLEKDYGPDAQIYIVVGADLFETVKDFRGAETLLTAYNWAVVARNATGVLPRVMLEPYGFQFEGTRRATSPKGHQIELVDLNLTWLSSTKVWNQYQALPYSFIVHATDPQWTFEDASVRPRGDQTLDGTLRVAGTAATVPRILRVLEAARNTLRARLSLSKDAHYMAEVENASINPEFHPSETLPGFPEHGMRGRLGPDGDRFATDIEQWLTGSLAVVIPAHHEIVDDKGSRRLELVPLDINQPDIQTAIQDPNKVFIFEKNGPGAHSVFSNPRFETYLQTVDPQKLLPQFHFGWCTDFCDIAAIEGASARGYRNLYFVVDAAAGVLPALTARALVTMAEKGVRFLTTREFESLTSVWKEAPVAQVLHDLSEWRSRSATHAWVLSNAQAVLNARDAKGEVVGWTNDTQVPRFCEFELRRIP